MKKVRGHQTAMKRSRLSTPARFLIKERLLRGDILDYGCGRGDDARFLKCDKFDPHYHRVKITKQYDTILCTYVLNVCAHPDRVIEKVIGLLKDVGTAYFSVRRDVPKEGTESQVWLTLTSYVGMRIIKETPDYAIGRVRKK